MRLQDRKPEALICRIDLTAFLSIQLVLLSAFMATLYGPDLPMNGTDLAKVTHPVLMPAADREDAILVAVQRDGKIWLGSEGRLSPEQLRAAIQRAIAQGSERKAYIRVDMRARYGAVREALTAVRSAGIEKVGFLVDQRPSSVRQ